MRSLSRRRLALWTIALAVPAVLVSSSAGASSPGLTRARADRLAIKILRPGTRGPAVVLFGLRRPVKAGQTVFEERSSKPSGVRVKMKSLKPVGRAVWLYWEDLLYNAGFEHPSRLLMLDARTGRVLVNRPLRMYPLVDGRMPPFLKPAGYYGARYVVFSGLPHRARTAQSGGHARRRADRPPLPAVKTALASDCLLIIGDQGPDQRFFESAVKPIQNRLASYGLTRQFYVRNGGAVLPGLPVPDKPAKEDVPPDGKDLQKAAARLAKGLAGRPCPDIMILVAGHGTEVAGGKTTVGSVSDPGHEADYFVTGEDLAAILAENTNTTFKLKVDSCYSGNFTALLGPKDRSKNLLVAETSADAEEPSWFKSNVYINYKTGKQYEPAQAPAKGTVSPDTFTESNLAGWEAFATSPDRVAAAQQAGGPLLAHMIDDGFTLGAEADEARAHDITHPTLVSKLPPKPKPIHAVFDQSTFTTTYTENASGQGLQYEWSVRIDTDILCARGFKGSSPQPNQATWYHADVSQGGPCNHTGDKVYGPRGHLGTVTVVFVDPIWSCTATYDGTISGDGPQPEPCHRY